MRAFLSTVAGFVVGVAIALAVTAASAQGPTWSMSDRYTADKPSYPYQEASLPATPRTPFNHHTSTLAEGVLRGQAAVIESVGVRHVLDAQARILNEEARSRHYKNRVINTETFLAERQAKEEDWRERRLRRWEWLERARDHRAEREMTVLREAYHVPSTQLDRMTGEITWPAPLTHPMFAELRTNVQTVVADAANPDPEYAALAAASVADAVEELRDAFRVYRDHLGVGLHDYFDSQSFLVGLKFEVQSWGVDGEQLAMASGR